MDGPGSITQIIDGLRSEDPSARAEAARVVWGHYFDRLLGLARGHLAPRVRRREDEEDVVQSVFRSFCRRQQRGDFDLRGRDDLWALLVTITLRKTRNTANRHGRVALEQMEAAGPTPSEAAALTEDLERRLESLSDPLLRRIALLRLEGHTNVEIAAELGCVERTVERKLERIRDKWSSSPARGD